MAGHSAARQRIRILARRRNHARDAGQRCLLDSKARTTHVADQCGSRKHDIVVSKVSNFTLNVALHGIRWILYISSIIKWTELPGGRNFRSHSAERNNFPGICNNNNGSQTT